MGKKRIIKKTKEELLKEREGVEKKLEKSSKNYSLSVKEGRIYINSTYNNIIITLTDPNGNVLAQTSAGKIGFKGTKKATPFAASKVAGGMADILSKMKIKKISIFLKGVGSGRDSALRSFGSRGIEIDSIKDLTPVPHNGCRPPKARRV
jgi:small subunit ribosomal protein S11